MKTILDYIREARGYITVLILMILVSLWIIYYLGAPVGGSEEPVVVVIPKGATAQSVGVILRSNGLVRSWWGFALIAKYTDEANKIKPGAYKFSKAMSVRFMLDMMINGRVAGVWVTIPEGFTARQIADRLAERNIVSSDAFATLTSTCAGDFSTNLHVPSQGLEGYLFTDTYLVPTDGDLRAIVDQMLDAFKAKVVVPLAPEIDKVANSSDPIVRSKALHRIIIVASMIEREAKAPKDRPLVSCVIWNRLRRGMKLQIDATVQYAWGEHQARLYYNDLTVDSPYNTYLYAGLPPGPISNPGLDSIKAALHPAKSNYLYYVARKDGSHIFSRTLEEHNAARQRVIQER
jgi:UPF0755 protein